MTLAVTHLATPQTAWFYWLLGSVGGILPDIDAPHSIPARLFFTTIAIVLAASVTLHQSSHLAPPYLFLLGSLIFFSVAYGLAKLFAKFTVHRGNFHSLLAALLFGLLTTVLAYRFLEVKERIAWWAGTFVTGGYFLHLLLDEWYSVDFMNRRIKASFGSALKLFSLRHQTSTLLLILITISVFLLTPNVNKVVKTLLHEHTYQTLKKKFSFY